MQDNQIHPVVGCAGALFIALILGSIIPFMRGKILIGILLLLPVVIAIVMFVIALIQEEKKRREMEQKSARANRYFKFASGTLTVEERNPLIKELISIVPLYDEHLKYTPAELVYTSVSMGGVTSGGFHVNNETAQVYTGKESGKYALVYNGSTSDSNRVIYRIKLTPELAAQAKKHITISKYLNKDTLVLKNEPGSVEEIAAKNLYKKAQEKGDVSTAYYASHKYKLASYLDSGECASVKFWLCGDE